MKITSKHVWLGPGCERLWPVMKNVACQILVIAKNKIRTWQLKYKFLKYMNKKMSWLHVHWCEYYYNWITVDILSCMESCHWKSKFMLAKEKLRCSKHHKHLCSHSYLIMLSVQPISRWSQHLRREIGAPFQTPRHAFNDIFNFKPKRTAVAVRLWLTVWQTIASQHDKEGCYLHI